MQDNYCNIFLFHCVFNCVLGIGVFEEHFALLLAANSRTFSSNIHKMNPTGLPHCTIQNV